MSITATRYHDISCGHRVAGHESKCAFLHGHNYRIHFECIGVGIGNGLDRVGRVIDFSAIKERLCIWLEEHWDHRFLAWEQDSLMRSLADACNKKDYLSMRDLDAQTALGSIVWVPFNPTAENMARYLLEQIGPLQLPREIVLVSVRVEETRKCSAQITREGY